MDLEYECSPPWAPWFVDIAQYIIDILDSIGIYFYC